MEEITKIMELQNQPGTTTLRGFQHWQCVSFNEAIPFIAFYSTREGTAKLFLRGESASELIAKVKAYKEVTEFQEKVRQYKPSSDKWTVFACFNDKLEVQPE